LGYLEKTLSGDERVVHRGHISLWASWLTFALGGLAILFGLMLLSFVLFSHFSPPSGLGWFVFLVLCLPGFALIMIPLIRRRATELAVTNKRVIVKFGLLTTHALEIRLSKIETVRVNQGLIGRLFNYGTIVITGTGATFDPIPKISSPFEFHTALNGAMEQLSPSATPTSTEPQGRAV